MFNIKRTRRLVILMFSALVVTLGVGAPVVGISASGDGSYTIYVNGNIQDFGAVATEANGTLIVPLEGIFEIMGIPYVYDESSKTVTATYSAKTVEMKVDTAEATINGVKTAMSSPMTVTNGELRVPLDFAATAFGFKYTFNRTAQKAVVGTKEKDEWWFKYPTMAEYDMVMSTGARAARHIPMDFAWGVNTMIWNETQADELRQAGKKIVGYFETSGQVRTYLVGYYNTPEEGITNVSDGNAWSFTDDEAMAAMKYFDYAGLHADINNSPILGGMYTRESLGYSIPTYPDGREALGYDPDSMFPYPVNAFFYDAVCGKGIDGQLNIDWSMLHPTANENIATINSRSYRDISMAKDIAAPFWREHNLVTAKEFAKLLADGAWFDNYSPWDNNRVTENGLGDWTIAGFRKFLTGNFDEGTLMSMGINDVESFDMREYLRSVAQANGLRNPDRSDGNQYTEAGYWIDDPICNAFKVYKMLTGREYLQDTYFTFKSEASAAGVSEGFMVAGNDMPGINQGWVTDGWLDVVGTEITTGWCLPFGSHGLSDIPIGKMACFYPTVLEQQSGPFSSLWFYASAKLQDKTEAGKVLLAEAFANSSFIKAASNTVGTIQSHNWLNAFAERVEPDFGVRYQNADIAVVFSPEDQLGHTTPGSYIGNMDKQYHSMGLWGFCHALVDAHMPFKVLPTWKLNEQTLKTIKTLILPNVEFIDDDDYSAIATFVENGGRLIITGPAGLRKGYEGMLEKRERAIFSDLAGRDISSAVGEDFSLTDRDSSDELFTNAVGGGQVVWCAAPIGYDYFYYKDERAEILPKILDMVGGSSIFDGSSLPFTVGSFLWKSTDGGDLYVDLVNYNVDLDSDTVIPAENLTFSVRLPEGYEFAHLVAYDPDIKDAVELNADISGGWATVTVDTLVIYKSFKFISANDPEPSDENGSPENSTGPSSSENPEESNVGEGQESSSINPFVIAAVVAAVIIIAAAVLVMVKRRGAKKPE